MNNWIKQAIKAIKKQQKEVLKSDKAATRYLIDLGVFNKHGEIKRRFAKLR